MLPSVEDKRVVPIHTSFPTLHSLYPSFPLAFQYMYTKAQYDRKKKFFHWRL